MRPSRTLPDAPDLERYRREAKERLGRYQSGDEATRSWLTSLVDAPEKVVLATVQLAIAREHGFESWGRFRRQVERLGEREGQRSPFERAVAAIHAGDVERVAKLVGDHPEILEQGPPDEYSLLHHAASFQTKAHPESGAVIALLIDAGMSPDTRAQVTEGATALHFAATLDHLTVIEALLAAGASVELEDMGRGGTPLAQALFYGARDAAARLARVAVVPDNLRIASGLGDLPRIAKWFDGNALRDGAGDAREFYRAHDEFPERPTTSDPQEIVDEAFLYACKNGHTDAAAFLLERGASVDAKPHFETALHAAAFRGDTEQVDWLLTRGADPTIRDGNWCAAAFGWAHYGGHPELHAKLLELAADRDLFAAAVLGDAARVKRQLEASRSPEELGDALMAALECGAHREPNRAAEALIAHRAELQDVRIAARLGRVDDTRRLLDAGGDLEMALQLAADHQRTDVAELCLARGAKPTLHHLCSLGRLDEVKDQLNAGEDIDGADIGGQRPLHKAIRGGAVDVVRFLLDEGADVDANADIESFGTRAIHVAALVGADRAMIDTLVAYGAEINLPSNAGTPLDCALREGHSETAAYLDSLGARTRHDLDEAW